jgi:co-chaperonin GroES (HSP10)
VLEIALFKQIITNFQEVEMSALNPIGDYLVAVSEEAKNKTASGLYLPEQAQEKPQVAKVVAVGDAVKRIKEWRPHRLQII